METITIQDGRKVQIGLIRTTPGRMLESHGFHGSATPPPPSCINSNGTVWDMDGNDRIGDCVTVYLANWIEMVTGAKLPWPCVKKWVYDHGYQNGANIQEAIIVMGRDPIIDEAGVQYTVGDPLGVNYENDNDVMLAIYTYKGLDLGIDASVLQSVVGSANGWVLHGLTRPHQNINHSVGDLDYGDYKTLANYMNTTYNVSMPNAMGDSTPCATLGTWGTIGIIELASQKLAVGEAWAIQGVKINPAPNPNPTPTPTPVPPAPSPWHCPWSAGEVEGFMHAVVRGAARAFRSLD